VLVHLRDGGDYFLDFGSERVRPGSASEYVRLFGGVWCFRSMQKGSFSDPLPFLRLNEFRIPTQGGHVVSSSSKRRLLVKNRHCAQNPIGAPSRWRGLGRTLTLRRHKSMA
jgi:hypothetical protein